MLFNKIEKKEFNNFYQAKFDYYKVVSGYSAILTALLEISYFVSDCQLFGRFAYETLLPRFAILIPLVFFCLLFPRVKSYKLGAWLYYMIPHASMWCTIWAIYYLQNRDFAREGFIIMHFAFLAIGLAMPLVYHIPFHFAMILNIVISNNWIHYDSFNLMISLALPVLIGVCIVHLILENSYADHYLTLKELERVSVCDSLTGVYNRYKLQELVDPETDKFTLGKDLSVLMIDIDHFKQVNDTYGHEAGDKILCYVVDELKLNTFDDDVIIRWGGEEFVVFLVNYEYERAITFANKLRSTVEEGDNGICPITISVGLCQNDDVHTYTEIIDMADEALYFAKKHGRNQVVEYNKISKSL